MAFTHVLAVDLAKVWRKPTKSQFVRVIGWGDPLEVLAVTDEHVEVRIWDFTTQADGSEKPVPASGFIIPKGLNREPSSLIRKIEANDVLKIDFVDVQQGDGSVIETPAGKVVLVDGGDNQLFARYLAGRFRTTEDDPLVVEAIVVSHGDADHFEGLTEIRKSEHHKTTWKRLFLAPRRVFHNGLVKRPEKFPGGKDRPDKQMLGPTREKNGKLILTPLVDDPRAVAETQMNGPFREWKASLDHWTKRGPIEVKAIGKGSTALDFLATEGIGVEVLGPIRTTVDGKPGLPFLGRPPEGPRLGVESLQPERKFTGASASHTINGHSIILRLTYGDVRVLLTGDLNEEASASLLADSGAGDPAIEAEVFKVPHHGSADFDPNLLKAVSPVVSVVSSGDESAQKEHIHPRATLVGALGRHSRIEEPLVLVTELVAFFEMRGWTRPEVHKFGKDKLALIKDGATVLLAAGSRRPAFFAFKRRAFGLVRIRTDGHRLLVYTDSGQADLKEAYAYEVVGRQVTPDRVVQA